MLARPVRRITSAALALVLLAQGCGGPAEPAATTGGTPPGARPTATAAGTATAVPPSPAAPTPALASPTGGNAEGYVVVPVPEHAVRVAGLPAELRFHRIDTDGPLAVLDEMPRTETSLPRSIYVVDLAKGTVRTLRPAPEGYTAWTPAISGDRVAWIEFHDQGANTRGPLSWRIVVAELPRGRTTVLASGVQRRDGLEFGASWPPIALDGGRLAYAVEDPLRPPDGWVIRVISASSGTLLRSIPTDLPVYDVGVSGDDLAWTEGRIDPQLGFTYDTRLWVRRASDTAPIRLGTDASEMAFRDGRLTWMQDHHETVTGAPAHTRIWTALASDLVPEPAAPGPQLGSEQWQAWPSTGDGFVAWDSARLSLEDTSVNGDRYCVWDPRNRVAYELDPTYGAVIGAIGGGWFVWVNQLDGGPQVLGMPIAKSGLP